MNNKRATQNCANKIKFIFNNFSNIFSFFGNFFIPFTTFRHSKTMHTFTFMFLILVAAVDVDGLTRTVAKSLSRATFLKMSGGVLIPLKPVLIPLKPANAIDFTPIDKLTPGSKVDALDRLNMYRTELCVLCRDFDFIKKGGGDEIRRWVGTVNTQHLYGVNPTLKYLQGEATDIVTYTESMDEFRSLLTSADTAAYSSLFVEFSAAKGTADEYLNIAKGDLIAAQRELDIMFKELELDTPRRSCL